jgi:hypothetical protein
MFPPPAREIVPAASTEFGMECIQEEAGQRPSAGCGLNAPYKNLYA